MEVAVPIKEAKQRRINALLSLKMPPLSASPGLPREDPSVLHFIQLQGGGFQLTYLINGA